MAGAGWPVEVGTKSPLILRDLDLLAEASRRSGFCCIFITITTVDGGLASIFEPSAPSPSERLSVVKALSDGGLDVCVAMIPVFPYITDDFDSIFQVASEARDAGAKYFMAGELTLPGEVRKRFTRLLEAHFPELLPKYESLYGASGYPPSSRLKIQEKVEEACRRLGLSWRLRPRFRVEGLEGFL
ncbi:MAG: hypothetical protein DRO52_04595 [Candidatus Hecatellales archaeon]|nr:MAG: hypothetical protein DRO52_04595 [Candidatus Hecatellales archaeon]